MIQLLNLIHINVKLKVPMSGQMLVNCIVQCKWYQYTLHMMQIQLHNCASLILPKIWVYILIFLNSRYVFNHDQIVA